MQNHDVILVVSIPPLQQLLYSIMFLVIEGGKIDMVQSELTDRTVWYFERSELQIDVSGVSPFRRKT